MDWIHCNFCSRQPGDEKERRFVLTSCAHIYCDLCTDSCTKEKCKICDNKCNTIQLAAKMQPDVQHFFSEPEDIIKKALKVMEFQKEHRQRLTSHRRQLLPRELASRKEIKILKSRICELEGQVSELKKAVRYYEHKMNPNSRNTASCAKSPLMSNSSNVCTTPLTVHKEMPQQSPMLIASSPAASYHQQAYQLAKSVNQNQLSRQHQFGTPFRQFPVQSQFLTPPQQHTTHNIQQQPASPSIHRSQSQTENQSSPSYCVSQQIQHQNMYQHSLNLSQSNQQRNTQPMLCVEQTAKMSGAQKIVDYMKKIQQEQQQSSPAKSAAWVTPNRLTLNKGNVTPSNTSSNQEHRPTVIDDGQRNLSIKSRICPSLMKRLPGKISPYRGLSQASLSSLIP